MATLGVGGSSISLSMVTWPTCGGDSSIRLNRLWVHSMQVVEILVFDVYGDAPCRWWRF